MIQGLIAGVSFIVLGAIMYDTNRARDGAYVPDETGLFTMAVGTFFIIVTLYQRFRKKSGAGPSDSPPINDIKKTPE